MVHIRGMNTEMESHPIPTKHSRISVEESAVSQHQQEEMEANPQKRWLCNELVRELCKEIPIVNASEQILLTSLNIHAYLVPRFPKIMIYRDAIAFLKAKLNAKKNVEIRIDQMAQNKESEPIMAINQKQSDDAFKLTTNHFHVYIQNRDNYVLSSTVINVVDNSAQLECAHLDYFLRLIAPLFQPIHLYCGFSNKPIERLMRSLSGYIESIIWLSPEQFNSPAIDGTLGKCNKLRIHLVNSNISIHVPKLVHWLTNNHNSGQPKKYLYLWGLGITYAHLLLDAVKKDFTRSTSKRRFVVCLMSVVSSDEFTSCNDSTGERLQLRRIGVGDERTIYVLSRSSPNSNFDTNEDIFAEFGRMTMILRCT